MQVTANLAQDPHCVIIVPKEKKKAKSARQLTDAQQQMNHIVSYISSGETQTTVFLLWLTPLKSHMIFPQGGCPC